MHKYYLGHKECIENKIPATLKDCKVVLDWYSRASLRKYYDRFSEASRIYFKFETFCIDMSDEQLIQQYKMQALKEKDYLKCKSINEAQIEYSVITKKVFMDCYPMEIQIETTDMCNAKCIMCNHFYKQGTHANVEPLEMVKRLENALPYLRTIYLHGNGEPFIARNIERYLQYLGSYGIKFMTNTNLSVMNETILNLIKMYFTEINISIDAADKETYEYIRRGLSYERMIENCKKVRKNCPDLYMRMWCIGMRQNVMKLPEIVEFAADLGFNELVITELSSDPRLENEMDVMLHYPSLMKRQLEKAKEAAGKCGISLKTSDYNIEDNEILYEEDRKRYAETPLFKDETYLDTLAETIRQIPKSLQKHIARIEDQKIPCIPNTKVQGICDWAVERPFVDMDGNVSICCVNQHIILGNLFEEDFEKIWNSRTTQNIRSVFYQGKFPYFCSGCEFLLQCSLKHLHVKNGIDHLHSKVHLDRISAEVRSIYENQY